MMEQEHNIHLATNAEISAWGKKFNKRRIAGMAV